MDNGFGLASGNWANNAWKANLYKGSLNDFVQTDSTVRIPDAMSQDLDHTDLQLEFNEIDNYNPGAQARLAKYIEFM